MEDESYQPDGNDLEVFEQMNEVVFRVKSLKPNDRSPKDRYYATLITKLEEARALAFAHLVHGVGLEQ